MDHEDVRSVIHSEHTHRPGRGGHLHWHTPKAPPKTKNLQMNVRKSSI